MLLYAAVITIRIEENVEDISQLFFRPCLVLIVVLEPVPADHPAARPGQQVETDLCKLAKSQIMACDRTHVF